MIHPTVIVTSGSHWLMTVPSCLSQHRTTVSFHANLMPVTSLQMSLWVPGFESEIEFRKLLASRIRNVRPFCETGEAESVVLTC